MLGLAPRASRRRSGKSEVTAEQAGADGLAQSSPVPCRNQIRFRWRRVRQPTHRTRPRTEPTTTRLTGSCRGTHGRDSRFGLTVSHDAVELDDPGAVPPATTGTAMIRSPLAGRNPSCSARSTMALGVWARATRSRTASYRRRSFAVRRSTLVTRSCASAINAWTATPTNAATTIPAAQTRTAHRRRTSRRRASGSISRRWRGPGSWPGKSGATWGAARRGMRSGAASLMRGAPWRGAERSPHADSRLARHRADELVCASAVEPVARVVAPAEGDGRCSAPAPFPTSPRTAVSRSDLQVSGMPAQGCVRPATTDEPCRQALREGSGVRD